MPDGQIFRRTMVAADMLEAIQKTRTAAGGSYPVKSALEAAKIDLE